MNITAGIVPAFSAWLDFNGVEYGFAQMGFVAFALAELPVHISQQCPAMLGQHLLQQFMQPPSLVGITFPGAEQKGVQ